MKTVAATLESHRRREMNESIIICSLGTRLFELFKKEGNGNILALDNIEAFSLG